MNLINIVNNLFYSMIGVLKGFSKLGAFLIFIIGLGMLGVTIYGFIRSELIFNQYTILGILLGADILILIGSAIGIAGIRRGNGCLICIFQIFVLVFLVVFLGIGIGAELLPEKVFNGDCTQSNNELIKIADEAYIFADQQICRNRCACALTDDAINNGDYTV